MDEVESVTDALVVGKRYARKTFFKSLSFAAMDSIRKKIGFTKSLCPDHIVLVKMTYDVVKEEGVEYAAVMEPVADCNLQEYMEQMMKSRHHEDPQKVESMRK